MTTTGLWPPIACDLGTRPRTLSLSGSRVAGRGLGFRQAQAAVPSPSSRGSPGAPGSFCESNVGRQETPNSDRRRCPSHSPTLPSLVAGPAFHLPAPAPPPPAPPPPAPPLQLRPLRLRPSGSALRLRPRRAPLSLVTLSSGPAPCLVTWENSTARRATSYVIMARRGGLKPRTLRPWRGPVRRR